MPDFCYRVLDHDGEIQTGTVVAKDVAAASAELYRMGFTPLDISAEKPTFLMRLNEPIAFFSEPSQRDIQAFLRDLGRLLNAGLSMDESLKLLHGMQNKELFARAVELMREKVRQGESLASAMSGYKKYFNVQVVASVQAGEFSGTLANALESVAASMDVALSFKEQVRGALIYPAILMVMVCGTFTLVMTFVLPKFAPLFAGHEDKLPWVTRFVLSLSRLVNEHGYVLGGLLAFVALWLVAVLRDENAKAKLLKGLCNVPGIKSWLLTPDIIRFIRTLGVCTGSGVALDKALSMAADAVRMPHLTQELALVRGAVRRGSLLSQAFAKIEWIPPLVLQFVRVGEQSGRLGQMLEESANIAAQDYESKLEKALEVLSPLLTLLMGGIVSMLVGSVLLGIMSINDFAT
ncbi:type II secretion system F family protein [Kordiimonas marina]|uniref:type II secretion system F family protein n=1 Tax=Kordiimonas marina TaxID=2872312 RepID=UPI001FF3AD9F|nr:type II secretion system F family protein [Kordiimonas marina]MCJ9430041.1 type II secretion system F family protein [Kordiimonas marina]